MTQEDKDLLIKDLCARLPYRVKCNYYDIYEGNYCDGTITGFERKNFMDIDGKCFHIENIRPYLFPLSSMTEEQAEDLFKIFGLVSPSTEEDYIKINEVTGITFFLLQGFDVETHLDKLIDWLNRKHFDYRGLIEKGLALDATGLNIY